MSEPVVVFCSPGIRTHPANLIAVRHLRVTQTLFPSVFHPCPSVAKPLLKFNTLSDAGKQGSGRPVN